MSKPKKVNFELIEPMVGEQESEPYRVLREIRNAHHEDLSGASIALAWRKRTKADKDGHLVLGRCVKISELYREFADFDFVIVLNREIWQNSQFTDDKKRALMDHELCHAAPDYDEESGDRKVDERGRKLFRIRKHDIEEFTEIVRRHGCYKNDLQRFAEALLKQQKNPLFQETTVSMGIVDPQTGKTEYTEPIPVSDFVDRCEKIARQ